MKLHGGLSGEYTSVQRIFRAIVLRLRVPLNLYVVSDPKRLRENPSKFVSSCRSFIIRKTEETATFLANFATGKSDSCATHFRNNDNLTSWRGVTGMKHLTECNARHNESITPPARVSRYRRLSQRKISANAKCRRDYVRTNIDYFDGCRGTNDPEIDGFENVTIHQSPFDILIS